MTFEQAHIYIKLFILQHYDKNIEGVIPFVKYCGKVSELRIDIMGNYRNDNGTVFFLEQYEHNGNVNVYVNRNHHFSTDGNFNILDYIKLEEEC